MAGKNSSAKAKKQQSTAAATGSPVLQPAKEKQNAPATGSPEKEALPRQSPRKHAVSPGTATVPHSKRTKTHDTAETASVGEVHPYAFVVAENIIDPEKEGDPTCRGLCHVFFCASG